MKKFIHLQFAALFFTVLTAALAGPAHPAVPFRGSIQGLEIATVFYPLLYVDATASGTASKLGSFTATYELTVNLETHETFGTAVFTAANGDQLFTDAVGRGTPSGVDVASVVEVHTITGGTGRFAEATGNFIRTYQLELVTGATAGSFSGTIRFH